GKFGVGAVPASLFNRRDGGVILVREADHAGGKNQPAVSQQPELQVLALVIHHDDPAQADLHVLEAQLLDARDHVRGIARRQRPAAYCDVVSGDVHVPFLSISLDSYWRYRFFIQRTPNKSAMPTKARLRKPYFAVPAKRSLCLTGVS